MEEKSNVIPFPTLTAELQTMVAKAGLHAADPTRLKLDARFRGGITDLDVARVILAAERGAGIVADPGPCRWVLMGPERMGRVMLSRIVEEMIRTGLAAGVSESRGRDLVRVSVRVAPIHLRARRNDLRARCTSRALRLRRTDDPTLVDCVSCLSASR